MSFLCPLGWADLGLFTIFEIHQEMLDSVKSEKKLIFWLRKIGPVYYHTTVLELESK